MTCKFCGGPSHGVVTDAPGGPVAFCLPCANKGRYDRYAEARRTGRCPGQLRRTYLRLPGPPQEWKSSDAIECDECHRRLLRRVRRRGDRLPKCSEVRPPKPAPG
jgi:hypothetical protein